MAMFLHTWEPQAILATVGGFKLHWYGLMLALGAVVGLLVSRAVGRKRGLTTDHIFDLFIFLLIGGLIGARLYHVTNEWAYYSHHLIDILKVWNGGLAIHGAIIAGIIIIWLYAKVKKLNPWLIADVLAPGLVIGQAIGRWGNYFNQELFGRPTGLPWGIPIDIYHRPAAYRDFLFFHPTFLYEFIGSLIILGVLLWLFNRRDHGKKFIAASGTIALSYFILDALLRISTELLRIDKVPIITGVRLPLLASIIIILAAAGVWFWIYRRSRSHDSPSRSSNP